MIRAALKSSLRFTATLLALALALPAVAQDAVRVSTRPFAEVAQPEQGSAAASVLSPNDSVLSAELSAPLARVLAEVGTQVKKGQLLLELDGTDYRLAQAQAEAQLASAKASEELARQRFERAQQLREKQFVADDEVLAQKTQLQAAQAQALVADATRRVAARNYEKRRIIAPFDGVVTERMAQVGQLATPGVPLLRIVDLAPVEVEARVQAADAESLRKAGSWQFVSQGRRWPLKLQRLSPVIDAAARTQVARLSFVDAAAPAGSSGSLRWQGAATLLPATLLVKRGDALGAFVIENDKARFVPAPGAQEGRPFVLALPKTAQLVVAGQQGLNDGDAVIVSGNGAP